MNPRLGAARKSLSAGTVLIVLLTALTTQAVGQVRERVRGPLVGLHGIHVESSYGEGVSSAGGVGIEVAYGFHVFVAPYVSGSAISAGLGSGGWRTFEIGAQGRLPLGRSIHLHAASALGRRASSSFDEYWFIAMGGGMEMFVWRRLALHARIDRVVPFKDSPGYRRDRFGVILYLGQ